MTTKKKSGKSDELTPQERAALAEELDLGGETESDDLANLIGELSESGGGTVRVDRLREGKGREFVDEYDVSTFSLKLLRDLAGGGDYVLMVKDSSRRYRMSKRVAVAASAKPVLVTPQAPELSGLDKLAAAMQEQTKLLTLAIMRGSQAPDPNTSRKAMLEELQLMSQIVGGGGKGMDGAAMLDIFQKGIEVASMHGEGSAWPTAIATAADKLAEPISLYLAQMAAQRRQPMRAPAPVPRVPAARPGVSPETLPAAQPRTLESTAMPTLKSTPQLKMGVSFLVERAIADSDPTLYANLILDNVPDEVLDMFLGEGPDKMVEQLAGVDARVKDHVGWFGTLGQAVIEALDDDAGSASDATPPGAAGEPT